jgi:integrase
MIMADANQIINGVAIIQSFRSKPWLEKSLSRLISIVPDPFEKVDFSQRVLGLLSWNGEIAGFENLAGDVSLISLVLRNEIKFSVFQNPEMENYLAPAIWFCAELDKQIRKGFFKDVEQCQNIFTRVQKELFDTSIGDIVGPIFHRNLRLKALQVKKYRADDAFVISRLGSFINPPIYICKFIPPDCVKPNWVEYQPEELDGYAFTAVDEIQSIHNHRPATAHTYKCRWKAAVHGIGLDRSYVERGGYTRSITVGDIEQWLVEDQQLPEPEEDEGSRSLRLKAIDITTRQEKKAHNPRRLYPRGYIHGQKVCRNNLTRYSPNVLPILSIALCRLALNQLENAGDSNYQTCRAIFNLMLHTGQPAEFFCAMKISWAENISEDMDLSTPIYFPNLGMIVYVPKVHVGWPDRYEELSKLKQSLPVVWKSWRYHDEIYHPVSPYHIIFLPKPLIMSSLNMSSLSSGELSPLFSWVSKGSRRCLKPTDVRSIFGKINEYVLRSIAEHPKITEIDLRDSFEGYYNSYEFPPEMRYVVSTQFRSQYQLSIWYGLISSNQYSRMYRQAYLTFEREIADTITRIGEIPDVLLDDEVAIYDEKFFGSWQCARDELVRRLLDGIIDHMASPAEFFPNMSIDQARSNIHTLFIAIGFLLIGVRPQEVVRIKCRHIDCWEWFLAVDGKPHCDSSAARRLPIMGSLKPFITNMISNHKGKDYLLNLYRPDGSMAPMTAHDIRNFFARMLANFDPYSIRYLFCKTMLDLNISYPIRRYLMGHESDGLETLSIFGGLPMQQIYDAGRNIVNHIEAQYDFDRVLKYAEL